MLAAFVGAAVAIVGDGAAIFAVGFMAAALLAGIAAACCAVVYGRGAGVGCVCFALAGAVILLMTGIV